MSKILVHTRYLASGTDLYGEQLTGAKLSSHKSLLHVELDIHRDAEQILIKNMNDAKKTKIIYAIACAILFFIIPLSCAFYTESKLAKSYEDLYKRKLTQLRDSSLEIEKAIRSIAQKNHESTTFQDLRNSEEEVDEVFSKEKDREMELCLETGVFDKLEKEGYRIEFISRTAESSPPNQYKIWKGSVSISLEEYQAAKEKARKQLINEISFSF